MVVTGRHEDALWNRKPSLVAGVKPLADGFQNFPYPTLDIQWEPREISPISDPG